MATLSTMNQCLGRSLQHWQLFTRFCFRHPMTSNVRHVSSIVASRLDISDHSSYVYRLCSHGINFPSTELCLRKSRHQYFSCTPCVPHLQQDPDSQIPKISSQVRNIVKKLMALKDGTECGEVGGGEAETYLIELVGFLLEKEIPYSCIMRALGRDLTPLGAPLALWQQGVDSLLTLGFSRQQVLNILVRCPDVLTQRLSVEAVAATLNVLRGAGFMDQDTLNIAFKFPAILQIDRLNKVVETALNTLLPYFSRSQALTMLKDNPSILVQSEDDLTVKCEYVMEKFKVPPLQAIRSSFLRFSQQHVETRFQFLFRCGMLEVPDKRGQTTIENPTLRNITDTPNKYFARNVAKLTLAEYMAFIEIYALERDVSDGELEREAEDWAEEEEN